MPSMPHPFLSSRPIRRSIIALIPLLILISAPTAFAQFRDLQAKGWSTLKDGYGVLSSMCDDKGKRTADNFDTALGKILSSMADMSPCIDHMGEKVDDQDKSYAQGLRDNIRSAWKAVADAHEKAKRAYSDNKDSPDKLAAVSDELTSLKTAVEAYETACRTASQNYKAKWDDLKKDYDSADAAMKSARDKINSLDAKSDDIEKEIASIVSELDKVADERTQLGRASIQIFQQRKDFEAKMDRAIKDGKADDFKSAEADWNKTFDLTTRAIDMSIANAKKNRDLNDKWYDKEQELKKIEADTHAAMDDMDKAVPIQKLQRFSLWDAEFPGADYSFKTLK